MGHSGGSTEVLSVLVSLIIILGCLFIAAFVVRRWRLGVPWLRSTKLKERDGVTIITVRPVGWQASLQIVEADGQRFLIGASRAGITSIGRLTPEPRVGAEQRNPLAGGVLGLRPES
ncbi:MAG: hypothetical protein HIU92_16875 [Proteobacteria bacterium]|nr:hypothetical protein [Pseudomonadota bacterium]